MLGQIGSIRMLEQMGSDGLLMTGWQRWPADTLVGVVAVGDGRLSLLVGDGT